MSEPNIAPTAPALPSSRAPAAQPAPDPRANATGAARFQIPGDVIARTCADLPDDQRAAVKWLAGYCRQRNLSCADVGAQLRQPGGGETYSGDSIYQVLTGRRSEGSLERFTQSVDELRRRIEETLPRSSTPFVETSLTRSIFATCERALRRQKLSFIFGSSQIGKTTALAEYARTHNHGETVLIRMPTRGALGDFLEELAIRVGIGTQSKFRDLRRRIIESFDSRVLLIVDECHQCLSSHYSDRALASLEFAREIYDRRKCGLVLCGTDVFRSALRTNRVLRQLWLRGYRPLQLPVQPSKANLAEFALAFGLDPAPDRLRSLDVHSGENGDGEALRITGNPVELESRVIKEQGLGRWLSILEDAAEIARERGGRPTWAHVLVAHHQAQQLEAA